MKDQVRAELERRITGEMREVLNRDIYLWGTGNTAELYREGMLRLAKEGFRIAGYCDNNSDKWEKTFDGKPVISPDTLKGLANVCVLICSPQKRVVQAVGAQLCEMGVEWFHIDDFLFKTHRDQVLACYDLLEDAESKNVYAEVIRARMAGDDPDLSLVNERQYFALHPFMGKNPKEVFVDCGAFVGDSIEKFIWERDGGFQKIMAFEPDPGNFSAMEYRVSRLKKEWNLKDEAIEAYPYGIGEKSVTGILDRNAANNGLGSKLKDISGADCGNDGTISEEACKIVALDDFIKEPVTFIKADIESYEYKMLLGAKKTIQKYKPLLAICIYHNGVDMYSIPLLLKSMVPEYKMAVRHHSVETDETVLYAWIE